MRRVSEVIARRGGALAVGLLAVTALFLLVRTPAIAQGTGDFTYMPTSGPVGTVIQVHGDCPGNTVAGDAVALYRVSDGALVDAQVQLGNTAGGHVEPWDTTLTVKDMAVTSSTPVGIVGDSPVTPGGYEIRLFCAIGSSFSPPNSQQETKPPTPRTDAAAIKPFTVSGASTSSTTTTPVTTTSSTVRPPTTTTPPSTTSAVPATTSTTGAVAPTTTAPTRTATTVPAGGTATTTTVAGTGSPLARTGASPVRLVLFAAVVLMAGSTLRQAERNLR